MCLGVNSTQVLLGEVCCFLVSSLNNTTSVCFLGFELKLVHFCSFSLVLCLRVLQVLPSGSMVLVVGISQRSPFRGMYVSAVSIKNHQNGQHSVHQEQQQPGLYELGPNQWKQQDHQSTESSYEHSPRFADISFSLA